MRKPHWGLLSTIFPAWLFGEWLVRSRPVAYGEPLGEDFIDEPTKQAVREEFQHKAELRWRARYYWDYLDQEPPQLPGFLLAQAAAAGVVQYRAFNAGEELKAFLKQREPRVLAEADPHVTPLQIRVSFPVEEDQEELIRTVSLTLQASRSEEDESFVTSELFHQVVSTEGVIDSVGQFEVLNSYTQLAPGEVSVRNRVAKYLVQGDQLYEEAKSQAVSWSDYAWHLERLKTCIPTPYGEQCALK